MPPPPTSTLFPYTTLFRSAELENQERRVAGGFHVQGDELRCFQRRERSDFRRVDRDLLPRHRRGCTARLEEDRKSTRLNSSHMSISYAVFCLKKKMRALDG